MISLGLIYQLKEQTTKGYLKKMYDYSLQKLKTSLGAVETTHLRSRSSVTRSSSYKGLGSIGIGESISSDVK